MRETRLIKNYLSFKVCHSLWEKVRLTRKFVYKQHRRLISHCIFHICSRDYFEKNRSLLRAVKHSSLLKQSDNCVFLCFCKQFPSPHHHKQKSLLLYFFFCYKYTEQLLHYNDHHSLLSALFSYYYKDDKNTHTCSVKRTQPQQKHTFSRREMQQKHRDSFIYKYIWRGLLQQFWGALTLSSSQFHTHWLVVPP